MCDRGKQVQRRNIALKRFTGQGGLCRFGYSPAWISRAIFLTRLETSVLRNGFITGLSRFRRVSGLLNGPIRAGQAALASVTADKP